jgi:hypothetical protein
MNGDLFNIARENYINESIQKLERIKKYNSPVFKEMTINIHSILEDKNALINQLILNGIDNNKSILYYFTLYSNYDRIEICTKIQEYKKKHKKGKHYIAFPKVNYTENIFLYVGKTNKDFIKRFEYHLGIKTGKSVYALHLNEWNKLLKTTDKLSIKMFYAIIELAQNNYSDLEILESCLHTHLSPLLGREGH